MSQPPCLTSASIGAPHGFFTRIGGVSTGGYATLNGSLSGGDDRAAVAENRARAAARLGLDRAALLGVTQVHGALVVDVTQAWPEGAGPRADALVTRRAGLGLCIITADCAPVLFWDVAGQVVGAAHAGWRGALAGVLEATLAAMRALGAREVRAAIGPCIGQDSYEVGADLRDAVLAGDATAERLFQIRGAGHWQFDLAGYCAARLDRLGVVADRLGVDTYAEEERFFSHRRRTHAGGGAIGHQMSAIRL